MFAHIRCSRYNNNTVQCLSGRCLDFRKQCYITNSVGANDVILTCSLTTEWVQISEGMLISKYEVTYFVFIFKREI